MNEQPALYGETQSLVGVVTLPVSAPSEQGRPALILLNAGLVHRVGPHRLYVTLARRMAERGFLAARFDFSGIGDSLARADRLPYAESTVAEVREVMDALEARHGVHRFCLAGLSSGALVALATARADPRVAGAAMLNPHGFADSAEFGEHVEHVSQARMYVENLLKLDSWRKLVSGKTDYRRLGRTVLYRLRGARNKNVSPAAEAARAELQASFALGIPLLLVLSEQDRSLDNFREIFGPRWRKRLGRRVQTVMIGQANHTFANPVHLSRAVAAVEEWMSANWPNESQSGGG